MNKGWKTFLFVALGMFTLGTTVNVVRSLQDNGSQNGEVSFTVVPRDLNEVLRYAGANEPTVTEDFEIVYDEAIAAFVRKDIRLKVAFYNNDLPPQEILDQFRAEVIGNRWEGMK